MDNDALINFLMSTGWYPAHSHNLNYARFVRPEQTSDGKYKENMVFVPHPKSPQYKEDMNRAVKAIAAAGGYGEFEVLAKTKEIAVDSCCRQTGMSRKELGEYCLRTCSGQKN